MSANGVFLVHIVLLSVTKFILSLKRFNHILIVTQIYLLEETHFFFKYFRNNESMSQSGFIIII